MQIKPFFSNGFSLCFHVQTRITTDIVRRFRIQRLRSAEGVGNERRDGADDQRREIQHTGRVDFGVVSGGETGSNRGKNGIDLEVTKGISTLIELEIGVWTLGDRFDGRDMRFGRRIGCRNLLGGFGRSGEHLDNLFEGGRIGLDESGRVWVCGFGSVHHFWRRRWLN